MIRVELARDLSAAGLIWRPAERDLFTLPGHDLDGQIFVVNPLPALVQIYHGELMVTFHASVEWALDYVLFSEALWLPSENQLRMAIEERLEPEGQLVLERVGGTYSCTVTISGNEQRFGGPDAETAYALALRALLERA